MKIKFKITAGYVLFALLAAVVGLIGTRGTGEIEQNFLMIADDILPSVKALEDLRFAGLRVVSSVSEYGMLKKYGASSSNKNDSLDTEKSLISQGKDLYRRAFDNYKQLIMNDPGDIASISSIAVSGETLLKEADQLIEMMGNETSSAAVLEKKEQFEKSEFRFLLEVNKALAHEYVELANEKNKEKEIISATTRNIGLLAFLTAIIALLAGTGISNALVRPLLRLRESAERIGKGDLEAPIDVNTSDEVGELATAFEWMRGEVRESRESLQVANGELEAFNYTVSHDLRSPLTSISGFSQLLMNNFTGKLDEETLGYIQRICTSTEKMNQLINYMLDFSMLSHRELNCREVDLSAVAQLIAAELENSDQQRKADFRINDGMTAIGDPPLLDLVLTNLLGNAWKYTRNNEVAVITFSMKNQDGISVYSVQDNGEGFDMEKAGQLFTPFQRLHNASEYEGHGIGLATVDRIIKRHGGRCWGVSEPGHGATFFFTLQETLGSSTLNK